MTAERTLLVVSEPATIANVPFCAMSSKEGRSASGSSSPLCDRFQSSEHVGRDVLAYQVVKQILSICADPQPL